MSTTHFENRTIVAGAGVSGIRTAFDLAENGRKVLLIDKAAAHGGILPQLDHQFPDNHCGMCRMLPMVDRDMGKQFCLKKGLIHENIEILRSCEITDVTGTPGNLEVVLSQRSTGIDKDLCINCGKCEEVCPETAKDIFNDRLGERKAVFFPVPFQIPNTRTIDPDICTRCGECVKACEPNAINLEFEPQEIRIKNVPSVMLAYGNALYDPEDTDLYGFGNLENVVTATGFERLISQSGPTLGKAVRPSDGKPVKSIAWIQCVGSRNIMTDSDYCSSACCMFSLKEAVLAKEKIGKACDATIFYMDMRTHGRDYQRYRDEAETKHGVKFIRCRVHSVEQDPATSDARLTWVDEAGQQKDACFDLIVLATGKRPAKPYPDFVENNGVHIINTDNEFKDIGETVIDACAVSAQAAGIKTVKATAIKPVSFDAPSFLVAVCQCPSTDVRTLATDILLEKINSLPGTLKAVAIEGACTQKGFDELVEQAKSPDINRLIVLSCSSDLFLAKAKELEEKTGIHKNFMDFPQGDGPEKSELISKVMASYAMLKTRKTWHKASRKVQQHCVIAGAGPAGLSAADTLLSAGIPVTLVEKESEPGGNLKNITGEVEKSAVEALIEKIKADKNATLMTDSEISSAMGSSGSFSLQVDHPGALSVVPAGAVIIATGGARKETNSYGYDGKKIVTLFELEQLVGDTAAVGSADGFDLAGKKIVMVQCVDSREEPDNYCSRICCIKALKTALKIKEKAADADITVLYRDIMTYGEYEKIYTAARKAGIRFIPYEKDKKPVVADSGDQTAVTLFDPVLQEEITINADLVSLATGIKPDENSTISEMFSLNKTCDGFIKEADYKWRPLDTGKEGVFVCGLARRPVNAFEAMKEGAAAAMRAMRILNRITLDRQMTTAVVRHAICSRCELCIPSCPYGARSLDPASGRIEVDDTACQACGTCASVCPNNAVVISGYEDGGVMNRIESLVAFMEE